jgi:hypothetical protein
MRPSSFPKHLERYEIFLGVISGVSTQIPIVQLEMRQQHWHLYRSRRNTLSCPFASNGLLDQSSAKDEWHCIEKTGVWLDLARFSVYWWLGAPSDNLLSLSVQNMDARAMTVPAARSSR